MRIRDLGYAPGSMPTGPTNSILDIEGLHISQITVPTSENLPPGSTACKGVTVICPRPPKDFYKPCRASTFCFNGNGELTGAHQIADWGFTNTPIAITNTNSLGTVFDGCWDWLFDMQRSLGWDDTMAGRHFGTPVVSETCDWWINSDIRFTRLSRDDVKKCFDNLRGKADGAAVEEGQRGGGASMTCHQFTGGTGTSSRLVRSVKGTNYTVAALCQSNYGLRPDLVIGGVPIGKMFPMGTSSSTRFSSSFDSASGLHKDGSIVIIVVTDAPLTTTQLNRMARHVTVGLSNVGSYGVGRNSSGDLFLALSTAPHGPEVVDQEKQGHPVERIVEIYQVEAVKNESIEPFFYACAEAVEEAILNSMVAASSGTVTMDGSVLEGLPVEKVAEALARYVVRV